MSNRENSVLQFIKQYHTQHQIAPTLREIGQACSVASTSVVSTTLEVVGVASLEAATAKEYKLNLGPRLSRFTFQPSEVYPPPSHPPSRASSRVLPVRTCSMTTSSALKTEG